MFIPELAPVKHTPACRVAIESNSVETVGLLIRSLDLMYTFQCDANLESSIIHTFCILGGETAVYPIK